MSDSNGCIRPLPGPVNVCIKVILCVLPFAEFAIGAIYQRDCPRQPYVAIYLLVTGVVSIMLAVLSILPSHGHFGNHSAIWSGIVSLFFFCWFIAGNVWIYSIYEPNYNKTVSTENYCNKTLYLFAFWTINFNYILLGLALLYTCCSRLCLCGGD
ncbi:transmembrane protein 272-like [Acanthopagrus schlegelii]